MKGLLVKGLTGALAAAAFLVLNTADIQAGTGIYVGKDVSADGTTLIGVSAESDIGMAVVPKVLERGSLRKGDVIKCGNGYSYTLPQEGAKMVLEHVMSYAGYGQWNCLASNEYGVSVVAALTSDSCVDAVMADPFVSDGISEDKISQILCSTAKTAKEAVRILCSIYEEKGAAAAEIVFIADQDGAWVVENFTGHQYVATKLPDDKIATFSNEPVIRTADPDDPNTICSAELFTLPVDNGFVTYDENKNVDLILSYIADNQYYDEWHLRGWVGHDLFAPSEELDYDPQESYDVFFKPDKKVSIEQAFDFFRNRFEGTAYDLSDDENSEEYWGINNQAVANASVIQVFNDVPAGMSAVIWTTPANPTASPFIPIPALADTLPEMISTDIEEDAYADDVLQFDFAKLNSSVYPRRTVYGGSIRQYWEGMESVSAADVADSMRGKWKDAYESSAVKSVGEINDYVDRIVSGAKENCLRLNDELDWHLFRTGIRKTTVPDDMVETFECSFDAVSYAHSNGWETTIEGDVFTAVKDGKTIKVVFDGDDKGTVSFEGFDNDALAEDFAADEDIDENGDAGEEEAEEADEPEEIEEKPEEETDAKAEEVEEVKEGEPEKDETEELTETVSKQVEVDTIADLEDYFAEKIASVPRDGWAEGEIAKQLGDVAAGVTGIINRHFTGDVEELLGIDEAKLAKIAGDADIAKVGDKMVATGMDLAALSEKYFTSVYEDVSADITNGRLTQDGAIQILSEAEADIEGIATLYLEGLAGAFAEVFNTDLSDEELAQTLAELGEGTLDLMEEYGAIDRDALGLGDIELTELTDADIDVVITLNEMDDDVINGLSDLLGVDVRSTLDMYLRQIENASDSKVKVVEEKHENEKANAAPDEEVKAVIELQETLQEEDIEIPQEVIDILNEAIREAAEERGETYDDAIAAFEAEEEELDSTAFTIHISNVSGGDGKVMLPAFMLQYFN